MNLSKEIKIGATMVAAIAALIIGIQFLKGIDIFVNSRTFYGLYDQVDGLNSSSPVTVNGLKIGQIKEIELSTSHPGKVLVSISVTNRDFVFPRDSKVHLESLDLLGSKSIAIVVGKSQELAQDGDTLMTSMENGIMNEVNKKIAPLKIKAEGLLSSMDSVLAVVDDLLRKDARPNLDKSFESLRRTLESIERTSNDLDGVLKEQNVRLGNVLKNLESLTGNLNASNADFTNIIHNFSMLSDSLVKADVAKVITEAAETLGTASEVMEKVNKGEGSMGQLINDDELYNRLNSASDNLDALLEDFRLNPKKYISISLIERRGGDYELTKKDLEKIKESLKE
jgi:phospholipid/cholesterol/gamma-HCH transport system substrate-binding protein